MELKCLLKQINTFCLMCCLPFLVSFLNLQCSRFDLLCFCLSSGRECSCSAIECRVQDSVIAASGPSFST